MQKVTWIVSGRVQGIGYRAFVQRHAAKLGLVGYAKNLYTGDVEVCAEGDEAALRTLESQLRLGPRWAQVSGISASWGTADGAAKSFHIR